jgi:hypothetical protein
MLEGEVCSSIFKPEASDATHPVFNAEDFDTFRQTKSFVTVRNLTARDRRLAYHSSLE